GSQTRYVTGDVERDDSIEQDKYFYHNQFKAIPADVQFRPQRKATWPRIYGNISAKIDATEASGNYAYLDAQGRYKVILPFDLSTREAGKASAWIRMAQMHAGGKEVIENKNKTGVHFPLRGGTEVLLSFIDGDPDRPVITGAVPNPDTESVITSANNKKAVISTEGDNRIIFDDEEGTITFKSGNGSTYLVGDESTEKKNNKFDITKGFQIGMTGLTKGIMSMFMNTNITGWKKATLLALAAENALEVGSEIFSEKYAEEDKEEGGFKWNWGETLVVPVFMLFVNLATHKILHNFIEKKLEGGLDVRIPTDLCYSVINKNGNTIQSQNSHLYGTKKKNMLFAAGDGEITFFAKKNMNIYADEDIELYCDEMNYLRSKKLTGWGKDGILLLSSSGARNYDFFDTYIDAHKGITIMNK
ncbi:hypothetical protein KA005_71445, partial [bacterium]|nr:hypothetical protein [bacterium]